jgi:hypothetical protein
MDNYTHVDYISISAQHAHFGNTEVSGQTQDEYFASAAFAVLGAYPSFLKSSRNEGYTVGGGGAGYKHRLFFRHGGWTVFYGASHGYFLVQLPGEACHRLRDEQDTKGLAVSLTPIFGNPFIKCTRIDVASNWRCGDAVDGIAQAFTKKVAADYPRFPSETGITQYIGSPKSEKSCKVYRYAPPHPRHEWIRIEFRFAAPMVGQVQEALSKGLLTETWVAAAIDWGFDRSDMLNCITVGSEQVKLAYKKRQDAGSVAWVYGTALRAVRDAIAAGDMSLDYALTFIKGEG